MGIPGGHSRKTSWRRSILYESSEIFLQGRGSGTEKGTSEGGSLVANVTEAAGERLDVGSSWLAIANCLGRG